MLHQWSLYISPRGKFWDLLANDQRHAVLCVPTAQGVLWVFRSRFGYAKTHGEAREWVEALVEAYDPAIPPQARWIAPLASL